MQPRCLENSSTEECCDADLGEAVLLEFLAIETNCFETLLSKKLFSQQNNPAERAKGRPKIDGQKCAQERSVPSRI
jgi:hypothetical protein